jgi:hypothetical protein
MWLVGGWPMFVVGVLLLVGACAPVRESRWLALRRADAGLGFGASARPIDVASAERALGRALRLRRWGPVGVAAVLGAVTFAGCWRELVRDPCADADWLCFSGPSFGVAGLTLGAIAIALRLFLLPVQLRQQRRLAALDAEP